MRNICSHSNRHRVNGVQYELHNALFRCLNSFTLQHELEALFHEALVSYLILSHSTVL